MLYRSNGTQDSLFFFLFVRWDFGSAATTGLLYQPRMIDDGDCGETGGMKIGKPRHSSGG
jgi:hypothetical protein